MELQNLRLVNALPSAPNTGGYKYISIDQYQATYK